LIDLLLIGVKHLLGSDELVESLRVEKTKSESSFLESSSFLVSLLCALGDVYLKPREVSKSERVEGEGREGLLS
jgi:hypothetical protein